MAPLEKLGAFYLGREFDLEAGKRLDQPVVYDARDLTTHSVCVGMTGSGKTEREFAARAQQIAREKRDAEVDKLRRKYRTKLDRLEKRLRREERELQEDKAEYSARKREEMLSAGETVIGLLGIFGSRKRSSGLSTAARRRRMTARAKEDITESQQEIARLQEEIEEMSRQMEEDAAAIAEKWEAVAGEIETYPVKPRRTDVKVDLAALAWAPSWEIAHESVAGRPICDWVAAWAVGPAGAAGSIRKDLDATVALRTGAS